MDLGPHDDASGSATWDSPDAPHDVAWVESRVVETWDFSDASVSRLRFLAIVDALPPGSPAALVYRTQVARAHALSREFDAAHETLDAAESRWSDLDEVCGREHVRARLAIERGRALNSSGAPAEAMAHFEIAYEEARRAGAAGLAIDALHMSAIAAGAVDGPASSMRWNERAIAEAEASDDPAAQRWLGSLLNNYGWDKHDAGDFDEALQAFERALAFREGSDDEPALTVARWAVGRALRSLCRYDEALAIHDALAATEIGADDGFVHEERGECLLGLERPTDAAPAFALAYALLSADEWFAENEPERLARLRDLAHPLADPPPG